MVIEWLEWLVLHEKFCGTMHVISKFPSCIVTQVLRDIEEAGQMAYIITLWRTMLDIPKTSLPFVPRRTRGPQEAM